MNQEVDYYRVLDILPQATGSEIKAAYRLAAKAAHPDAGGTASAMQLVNEAYTALSDAAKRREYDNHRAAAVSRTRPAPNPTHSSTPPTVHTRQAPVHHPTLDNLARLSALRIIGYNAVAAALLGPVTSFMSGLTTDRTARVILAIVAFIPVYNLAVGIVFMFKPRLRIALARLGAWRLPPSRDLWALIGVGLLAFPLAAVWLVGYFSGTLR